MAETPAVAMTTINIKRCSNFILESEKLPLLAEYSIQVRYLKGPLSQKSAGHMQNRKTKTNTNPVLLLYK